VNIWEYIDREHIPIIDLYFDRGDGKRYRSLGCGPCTAPIESTADSVPAVLMELVSGKLSKVAERAGRAQDAEDGGGLESLRREGYM
jgi:sulfate adenylyltransferase subunit 2